MSHVAAAPAAPAGAGVRPGYDATPAATAARVLPMLGSERVVWLSTVHPDGTPHLVPTWFWWDGRSILCWSKPAAVKVRNLRANPRLMVAVGDPGTDFAVGLIEAVAELAADAPVPDAFFAKYGDELADGRLDAASYRALYSQAIRITPTRFLAWHGRGARHDGGAVAPAGAAVAPSTSATVGGGPGAAVAGWLAGRLDRLSLRLRAVSVAGAAAG